MHPLRSNCRREPARGLETELYSKSRERARSDNSPQRLKNAPDRKD